MSTTKLPSRFSLDEVRRYLVPITRAITAHPSIYQHDPSPLSAETFACRLRDCFASLHKYQWPILEPSLLDKFNSAYGEDDLKTSNRGEWVITGSRSALKSKLEFSGRDADKGSRLQIDSPTIHEVSALVILCANKRLPSSILPIRITNWNPLLNEVEGFEASSDVSFSRLDDGSYDLV